RLSTRPRPRPPRPGRRARGRAADPARVRRRDQPLRLRERLRAQRRPRLRWALGGDPRAGAARRARRRRDHLEGLRPDRAWAERRTGRLEGALAGQPGEVLAAVRAIAERAGSTVAQVALKWVISHPEVTCAISGTDTDAQMDDNLGAVTPDLAPEEIARLDA